MTGRRVAIRFSLAVALALGAFASPSSARTHIAPYIELDQSFLANLKGGSDDVLTWTSVAVGLDASATGARAEGTVSLRYEHQFGWGSRAADSDIVSGLAAARYSVIPGALSVEGGALATRVRTDGYSGASGSLLGAGDATTHVWALYAGPTLTTHVRDLSVNAAYRIGYTRIDDDPNLTVGGIPIGAFDESVYHVLTGSVGMSPGPLPFGWTLSAGYERENVTELDQRYESAWGRGDVTVPVTPSLALAGGVGYEDISISQRAALLDPNGNPVIGGDGGLVSDTSQPRLLAYDTDGLIWDAGVLWRPSKRTSLELRVGERYGHTHYVGSFSWRTDPDSLLQIVYFDRIDSFGRAMNAELVALPTDFTAPRNPFSGDLTGCATGANGGTCFNDVLAAISASNYRNRGLAAQYTRGGRRLNWGAMLGWSQRKLIVPNSAVFTALRGVRNDYYYGELFGTYRLDPRSSLGGSIYANYLDAGTGGIDVTNYGSYVTYNRLFGRRLSAQASLGLDAIDSDALEQVISLLGQVGLRYTF